MIVVVDPHLPMFAPISDDFRRWSHILRRPLPRYATTFAFINILPTSINSSPTGLRPDYLLQSGLVQLMRHFSHLYSSLYKPRSSIDNFYLSSMTKSSFPSKLQHLTDQNQIIFILRRRLCLY